jgi:hypothetical protein
MKNLQSGIWHRCFQKRKLYGLPDSTLLSDFSQIIDASSFHTRSSMSKLFEQQGVSSNAFIAIQNVVEDNNWQKVVKHLSTNCKRNAYYRTNFPYFPPED